MKLRKSTTNVERSFWICKKNTFWIDVSEKHSTAIDCDVSECGRNYSNVEIFVRCFSLTFSSTWKTCIELLTSDCTMKVDLTWTAWFHNGVSSIAWWIESDVVNNNNTDSRYDFEMTNHIKRCCSSVQKYVFGVMKIRESYESASNDFVLIAKQFSRFIEFIVRRNLNAITTKLEIICSSNVKMAWWQYW